MAGAEGLAGMVSPFSHRLRRLKRARGALSFQDTNESSNSRPLKSLFKVLVPRRRREASELIATKLSGSLCGKLSIGPDRVTMKSCNAVLLSGDRDFHEVRLILGIVMQC